MEQQKEDKNGTKERLRKKKKKKEMPNINKEDFYTHALHALRLANVILCTTTLAPL